MGVMLRVVVGVLLCTSAVAEQRFITVASTTSTEQSGLFKHLLPAFEQKTGIQVRVVAVGTGQALDIARRGDADVVFVHAKPLEEKFLADGFGGQRFQPGPLTKRPGVAPLCAPSLITSTPWWAKKATSASFTITGSRAMPI